MSSAYLPQAHGATVIATVLLTRFGRPASATEQARTVNRALRAAASALGNTLAVCRKSYVHPGVVDAYLGDSLPAKRFALRLRGLRSAERRTLALLRAARQGFVPVLVAGTKLLATRATIGSNLSRLSAG